MLKLFFIAAMNTDGTTNLDQFVSAHTPEEAKELWEKWAEDFVGHETKDFQIFLVPAITQALDPMVHSWHSDEPLGVPQVFRQETL